MNSELITQIEAGDELTFDLEGEMDGVSDGETTLVVDSVDGREISVLDENGDVFGYLLITSSGIDEDAQLRTNGGQLLGRCHNLETDELGDDEPETVTDGGEDVTEHVDDEDIEDAIERHDDPGHPDALTVDDVRDFLAEIQLDIEDYWSEHMDTIEDGGLEVVEDSGGVVVFGDHTGHEWSETFGALGIDDEIAQSVIMSTHHAAAKRITDYSWSTADPFVIRKPNGDGGQRYVEAVVNSLQQRGLTPAQSWAVYGVHVAGYSRNAWGSMCGHDSHSSVSQSLRKVNEETPYIALADQ